MKKILVLALALMSVSAFAQKGGLDANVLSEISKGYEGTSTDKALRNAMNTTPLATLARNADRAVMIDTHFSDEVKTVGRTNQKSSGRCWLFTGLNVLRASTIERFDLGNFQFSQNYCFFYDQLEKANLFLQAVIDTRGKSFDDRTVDWLFSHPISDGGTFTGVADLVSKYGVVPAEIFPETLTANSTSTIRGQLSNLLRQDGLALRDVLRQDYGIAVTMTRETDDITLGGYTNGELDNAHLSLRGTFAEGADLFISLHTNANQDDVNGSPTCNQPVGINKTIVFVNRTALASETAMAQANAVGSRVTDVNEALGLSTAGRFEQRRADAIAAWSDAFNDSLDTPGTVCYRDGENHNDYYGVLRGAASVNVPGIIVEHGFHTVASVRQAAMQGDLARRWAEADAAGIAEGWGFVKL